MDFHPSIIDIDDYNEATAVAKDNYLTQRLVSKPLFPEHDYWRLLSNQPTDYSVHSYTPTHRPDGLAIDYQVPSIHQNTYTDHGNMLVEIPGNEEKSPSKSFCSQDDQKLSQSEAFASIQEPLLSTTFSSSDGESQANHTQTSGIQHKILEQTQVMTVSSNNAILPIAQKQNVFNGSAQEAEMKEETLALSSSTPITIGKKGCRPKNSNKYSSRYSKKKGDKEKFQSRMLDGNLLLTKGLRGDIVIKNLLRYIKRKYKEQFYKYSHFKEDYFHCKDANLVDMIQVYITDSFSEKSFQSYNAQRSQSEQELLTEEKLAFCMGAIFLNKRMKKQCPPSLHPEIEMLHGTLYSFSPVKMQNFRRNPALNFLLRDFLDTYAEQALIKDPKLKQYQEEYSEGIKFLRKHYY